MNSDLVNINKRLEILENQKNSIYDNVDGTSIKEGLHSTFGGDGVIEIKDLCLAMWSGRWLAITITILVTVVALMIALMTPNQYRATAILIPVSSGGSNSLSKLSGQFGGFASLAGINLGGNTEDKASIALEIIKTWGFLESFIEEENIQVEVFAVNGWNRLTNELLYDSSLYDIDQKKWVRRYNKKKGQKPKPSSWELYEEFKDRVFVSQDKSTGLVSISVEYYSPLLAKRWVDSLVVTVNNHIRQQEKREASRSIEFLKEQISETNVSEMHSVFYQLIEEQTKTLMLAEVNEEYVLKTVSPAKVQEKPSKPKRVIIVGFGIILGIVLSVFVVLLRFFFLQRSVSPLQSR